MTIEPGPGPAANKIAALKEALVGVRAENPDIRWIERPGWLQAVNRAGKSVYQNSVLLSEFDPGLAGEEVDRAIASTIGEYAGLGLKFRWIVGPWTRPADTGERLVRLGMSRWRISYGLCRPTAGFPEGDADRGITIEKTNAGSVDVWADLFCRSWGVPESGRDSVRVTSRNALSDPARSDYVARVDGVPAGISSATFLPRSAYFYNAAVLPEFRRRGISRSFVRAGCREGRERGLELATVYAFEDTSFPLLKKMGFEVICECPQYAKE